MKIGGTGVQLTKKVIEVKKKSKEILNREKCSKRKIEIEEIER